MEVGCLSRCRFTPSAVRDLNALYCELAGAHVSDARHMLDRLIEGLGACVEQPGAGYAREDLSREPVRFWPLGTCVVIYRPDTEPRQILRLVRSSRELRALLAER